MAHPSTAPVQRETYEVESDGRVKSMLPKQQEQLDSPRASKKVEESSSVTTTTTTTSSSCASPQTDSSSLSVSPAVESSNSQFRFKTKTNPVNVIEDALKTEKEFIEYVMSLSANKTNKEAEETFQNEIKRKNSGRVADSSGKVGLDHLDNLCKLMEQLSELKDANIKLKKRVQYLEDVKTLHEIHRDFAFPSNTGTKDDMILGAVHRMDNVYKCHTLATMSHIQKDLRERSKSTGLDELTYTKSKRKFPKWSKVKEALGLERSHQYEIKTSLKEDERKNSRELDTSINTDTEERKVSPARSFREKNWYTGLIHSSSEDILNPTNENSEQNTSWEQPNHPIWLCLSDTEIQQEHVTQRRKSSSGTTDSKIIQDQRKKSNSTERNSLEDQVLGKLEKDDLKKPTKTPWGRVKTIIQTRRDSLKQRQQKPQYRPIDRSLKNDQITDDDGQESIKEVDVKLENNTNQNTDIIIEKKRKPSLHQSNSNFIHSTDSVPINTHDSLTSSGQVSNLVQQLQRNLSQDFNKKIEEWEKIKAKSSTLKSDHKEMNNGKRGKSKKFQRGERNFRQRVKDINWLEKELQKVEAEMQRLTKEKQKCEKRSIRLERLKEAMLNSTNKKEVLVKTSAGEFRFEGISDAFTKKLYEWETKQGVRPELSTIALLDSCLKSKSQYPERYPLKKGLSRSETSLADNTQQSPNSSPSCKHSGAIKQISRANSEPDLSAYSGQKEDTEQPQSYSSADLLALNAQDQMELNDNRETSESNYCSLLEDNMYLLEQLRSKEDICGRLQGELQALDDKTELMTKKHRLEMERYKEKLWEIHRPGRKPRDLQSSLKLISCLKTKIEELQRCSEKLKLDRETLEDSFRYHSEQQARLADGLAEKMKELQEAGWSSAPTTTDSRNNRQEVITCDREIIGRLADLSNQLLQQAREVDKTLAERSRQVCHLRWELLHRDVSMILLQTEIHRVKWQGTAVGARRARFRQKRSWSSSERLYPKERDDSEAEEWLQNRLKYLSTATYSDWPKVNYGPSELIGTINEVKKTLLKLSTNISDEHLSDVEQGQEPMCREESEVADSEKYDFSSVINSRSSSLSSEISSQLCSRPDSRLYDSGRLCGQWRNSLGNISSISGTDISDSSSINETERSAPTLLRLPWKAKRSKDNMSTSSESSIMDEDSLTNCWYHARKYDYVGDDKYSDDDLWSRELNIQFSSLNEEEEECSSAGKDCVNLAGSYSLPVLCSDNLEPVEKQPVDRRSSSSSSEIIVDRINELSNLNVRTSSLTECVNAKQNDSSVLCTGNTETNENCKFKTSPILSTYVQRLNVSYSGSDSTAQKTNNCSEGSSNLQGNQNKVPDVTVATQKVKLSLFNVHNEKQEEITPCESGFTPTRTDSETETNRTGCQCAMGEDAGQSSTNKDLADGQPKQITDVLKLHDNKDSSAVNTLCKHTLLFSLNSPIIKNVAIRTPPQSPTSSPDSDSFTKTKPNWLTRSLFRQK